MHVEYQKAIRRHNLTGLKLVDAVGRYLLFKCPPAEGGHREVTSWILAVYPTAGDRPKVGPRSTAAKLLDALCGATVAVADPDLSLGDYGIDVFGDRNDLPVAVIARWNLARGFVMGNRGVSPTRLDAATVAVLDGEQSYDGPESIASGERHLTLFRVDRGYEHIGIFDRNGMTHANALKALIDAKVIVVPRGCTIDDYSTRSVPDKLRVDEAIKAPRRAPGTAPVNPRTKERYDGLLAGLGATASEYPLPELDKDAQKVVKAMSALYHARKQAGALKATPRQIEYATQIAHGLGLEPPTAETSRSDVSSFIAENRGAYLTSLRTEASGPPSVPPLQR